MTALLLVLAWRATFVLFGAVGFVWAFAWYRWFRDKPENPPSVDAAELAYIQSGRTYGEHGHYSGRNWRLLANRNVLLLCLMYFTQVYGFYLYITWLPTYLKESGVRE